MKELLNTFCAMQKTVCHYVILSDLLVSMCSDFFFHGHGAPASSLKSVQPGTALFCDLLQQVNCH